MKENIQYLLDEIRNLREEAAKYPDSVYLSAKVESYTMFIASLLVLQLSIDNPEVRLGKVPWTYWIPVYGYCQYLWNTRFETRVCKYNLPNWFGLYVLSWWTAFWLMVLYLNSKL